MDAAVARVRERMKPAGLDADYDCAYEHFDLTHFLLQARFMLADPDVDPLQHFLGNGPEAKASPEINFDMRSYLARHPERKRPDGRSPYLEWLEEGRAIGEVADPAPGLEAMAEVLGRGAQELADELSATRSDLWERLRTGTLGTMFGKAAEIEPLIGDVWTETARPTIPPVTTANVAGQVRALQACQRAAGFARARLLLVLGGPRWGGGRRFEGHVAHALAGSLDPHDIVVVYTDASGVSPRGRFPAGVREVDLAREIGDLDRAPAQRLLTELVRSFHADAVININSRLFYEALVTYGQALAASERLFLVMLCNEQTDRGNWVGIPLRFFYRTFDLVEGVITDSDYLAGWLRERHQIDAGQADRLHVLPAPVDPSLPVASPRSGDEALHRPQVFWAGRWDRQKRLDIALAVARLMPDVDFRIWGEPVLNPGYVVEGSANVRFEGVYAHLSELDLSTADAWLYTSGWDGVPSQLLEVGMTGIPIVGSLVGGTGEVLDDESSHPVHDLDDPMAYVRALREVLGRPEDARRRALALRERLLWERSGSDHADRVAGLLLGDSRGGERKEECADDR